MKMLRGLLFAFALSTVAHAQQGVQLPSGYVWGNPSASRALGVPATPSAIIDRAISGTQGALLTRNATVWIGLAPGTAGLPLLSGGAAANLAYGILGAAAGGSGINNGTFTETRAGTLSLPAVVQGDLWYGSAAGTVSALAKSASTSQFLKNSGASNNPAWAQPAIADISGWGTGIATALGINIGTAGSPVLNGGALGTPSSGTLTNVSGLPVSTGISGLGTGIATALAVNVGTAGAPVVNGGALGTPSSGTLTSATGLPVSTGISGLGTGVATALAVNVGSAGALVTNGGALGTPSSGTLTNATGLPAAGVTGTAATLSVADQTVSGGANITSLSQSTGNISVDCGARPLQYITNGGAFTITAPSNDGSCGLKVTNNGSAGAISFSGFSVGSNIGDALDTTNAHKFVIFIYRINGDSTYTIKALQ